MSATGNPPRITAWIVAKTVLPACPHRSSPTKFTQHQLFAGLVLETFLTTDYRGLVAHLQVAVGVGLLSASEANSLR